MNLELYQKAVRGGLNIDDGADPLAHCALGLTGESGEVADIIKKSHYKRNAGIPIDRTAMAYELGDVLWYLTNIADQMGYSIEKLAEMNIVKLAERRPEAYEQYLPYVRT